MNNEVRLGDICEFINGGAWSDKEYTPYGVPVLKVSNFKPTGFSLDDVNFLPASSLEKYKKNILRIGDLVIATVGSHPNLVNSAAGRACVVTNTVDGYLLNQNAVCIRTIDSELIDQRYLNNLGRTFDFLHYIQSRGKGAANQMRIAISAIKEYRFVIPSIKQQRRIADILSVYDDLIENNQKQIKLLEEAAMQLYKEWFVYLRFPGHENTRIVDGMPEGWKNTRFSDSVDIMSGGTPKTDTVSFYGGDIPFYTPKDSDDVFFAFKTKTTITEAGLKNCNSKLYPVGTVIITARGTVGKTSLLARPMAMNQSCYALKSARINSPYYLFLALNEEVGKLKTMANGGVFDTIIVKTFDSINIIVPESDILQRFTQIITPYMDLMKNNIKKVLSLQQARDMLLPKLMSGEIEV